MTKIVKETFSKPEVAKEYFKEVNDYILSLYDTIKNEGKLEGRWRV